VVLPTHLTASLAEKPGYVGTGREQWDDQSGIGGISGDS
jgi:hypothetical protein